MKISLFGSIIVFFMMLSPILSAQEKTLTVCEVLSQLELYRGNIIVVKGLIAGGSYHGFAIQDHSTKRECQKVAESGRRWPATISLTFPTADWTPPGGPLKISPDFKNIESSMETIEKLNQQADERHDHSYYYIATVIGELRSRDDIKIFYNPSQDYYAGNGYGSGGKSAALLVVKSITDLQLVDIGTLKRLDMGVGPQ
jgi:hypothetical protein